MARLLNLCILCRFNLCFFGGLFIWTVLYTPAAFVFWAWAVTAGRVRSSLVIRNRVRDYGYVCCKILSSQAPVRFEKRVENLPRPCIIVANHQSFFDSYCMGAFLPYNPVFVVRAWPYRIPLYGGIMRRAGYLNVEAMDQEAFLAQGREVLAEGAALLAFPEGTRSVSGVMGRFRSGVFKLAMETGAPVVPMCIDGLGRIFPRGSRFGTPGPARVILLPPVDPLPFREYGDLAHLHLQRHVKAAIGKEFRAWPLPVYRHS